MEQFLPLIIVGVIVLIALGVLWYIVTRFLVNIGATEVGIKERRYLGRRMPQGRVVANAGEVGCSAYHRVIPVVANSTRLIRGHWRKCVVGRRSDRSLALEARARPHALFGVPIAGAVLTRLERRAEDCGDDQSGQQGLGQD